LARQASPLPADPATIAAFLAAEAQAGTKASTISRRVAAIRYAHKLAVLPRPGATPLHDLIAIAPSIGARTT
jgi:hypothetical protein